MRLSKDGGHEQLIPGGHKEMSSILADLLVYEPKCGGRGVAESQPMSTARAHGAQINFGDLTP